MSARGRPKRVIDQAWAKDLYENQGKTIREIAGLVSVPCGTTTVYETLVAAGTTFRPAHARRGQARNGQDKLSPAEREAAVQAVKEGQVKPSVVARELGVTRQAIEYHLAKAAS